VLAVRHSGTSTSISRRLLCRAPPHADDRRQGLRRREITSLHTPTITTSGSALYGVLAEIDALGLDLLEVRLLEPEALTRGQPTGAAARGRGGLLRSDLRHRPWRRCCGCAC
jgi:hypothetical protein